MLSAPGFGRTARQSLVTAGHEIAESGLVVGSAGNISIRERDRMLITPRGAELGEIDPLELVDVSIEDGTVSPTHTADSRPSSEAALHRALYASSDARAVVHSHAHYCTVLSTLVDELPAVHYAITAFGGPVRVAPYETFGTEALANAVQTALSGRRAALMANHGAIVAGRDLPHAVALALQLEWLASVHFHALCAGRPRTLDADQLTAVVEQARELRYGLEDARA